MEDSDSISKNFFAAIGEEEEFFALEYCDAAAVLPPQNTKPQNESHMFNKETAETNRETAEEKNNLAREF